MGHPPTMGHSTWRGADGTLGAEGGRDGVRTPASGPAGEESLTLVGEDADFRREPSKSTMTFTERPNDRPSGASISTVGGRPAMGRTAWMRPIPSIRPP